MAPDTARQRPPKRPKAAALRDAGSEPDEEALDLCADGALSTRDAAVFAGVGRSTLFELARTERLHPIRLGGKTLWARRELARLLAQHREP